MNLKESLRRVNLFEHLPPELVDQIIDRGSTRRVSAGAVLAEQGARDAGLQLLLEGSATVHVNDQQVGSLGAGDYFGEMSLLDESTRTATVVAGPDGATSFMVSPLSFDELLDRQPEIARLLLKVLTARIRRLESGSA
ncbi:cyclic nucleotide-binding domain-containing protein [Intrasporangium sp.]|uniref:cyclic nucleotide-binding domain-containing protein n=1 Tax=Intrasporangium sp. TaxID=1925024 RepID=UPI003221B655